MKKKLLTGAIIILSVSCKTNNSNTPPLTGTWKLISGTTIKNADTVVTSYTQGQEMIKIITPTHFAFMRHDLKGGKDSTALYVAGGGRVKIEKDKYTEYLDYLNYREWEGNQFELEYKICGDTLTTRAVEKVEKAGISQINIETLIRVK